MKYIFRETVIPNSTDENRRSPFLMRQLVQLHRRDASLAFMYVFVVVK